jgi:glutamine amidotransferase PdxT
VLREPSEARFTGRDNNVLNGTHRVLLAGGGGYTAAEELVFSDGPVVAAHSSDVVPLATTTEGHVVAARQGRTIIAAYHYGLQLHDTFLRLICDASN